ncbi:MAG: hypothetical protein GX100_12260 [candidate division WS1 bacterium]|jgi:phage-related protein|nr:hypothetical protein [candidate division WS1 bacterium]
MLELVELATGDDYVICGLCAEGYDLSYSEEFISRLEASAQKKIWNLLKTTAQHGPLRNTEKWRALHGSGQGLYEFKSKPYRLLCFMSEGVRHGGHTKKGIIITHGFRKRSDKTPAKEIDRALRLKAEWSGDP